MDVMLESFYSLLEQEEKSVSVMIPEKDRDSHITLRIT
jgi:hypothetical protein